MLSLLLNILGVLVLVCIFFIFKGPSIWDRLLWGNCLSALIIACLLLLAVSPESSSLFGLFRSEGLLLDSGFCIDVAITFCLLGFIGTNFIAVFLRKRGL